MTAQTVAEGLRVLRLDAGALPELLRVQDAVCQALALPELYFPLTPAEMQELLGQDGICLGLACDAGMMGFLGLLFMGQRAHNVGQDLALPTHCLPLVAYLKTINIAPAYQAQGLQKHLQQALLQTLGAQMPPGMQAGVPALSLQPPADQPARPWQYLCSTVSPHNLASLQGHLASGFRIAGLKPKYRGYMRFLLMRSQGLAPPASSAGVRADVLDYATQSELLAQGWSGVRLLAGQARAQIQYQRLPESSHD